MLRRRRTRPVELDVNRLQVADQTIRYNDTQRILLIGDRLVRLTPTEYRLAKAVIAARAEWQRRSLPTLFYVPLDYLVELAPTGDTRGVIQHLSNAGMKLAPLGMRFLCLPGYGYTLHAALDEDAMSSPRCAAVAG